MLDKLNFLIALAQEQHFGRAAEACGVTQPTLSAGIKQLEGMLGVLLVQRGSRFIAFTPEGQRTLEWARRIVGDARALRRPLLLRPLLAVSFRLRRSMARRWRQQQPERPTEIKSRIHPKLGGCVHLGVIDEE